MLPFLTLTTLAVVSGAFAAPKSKRASDCTTTINSIDDAANAGDCTTVEINSFTVPAGQGFELDLADGSTVNLSQLVFVCSHKLYADFPCPFVQTEMSCSEINLGKGRSLLLVSSILRPFTRQYSLVV